jgi:hypothetical protein
MISFNFDSSTTNEGGGTGQVKSVNSPFVQEQ